MNAAQTNANPWDFSSRVSLNAEVCVNFVELLTSTGLPSADYIVLVALVECPSTGYRATTSRMLSEASLNHLKISVELEPGQFASNISASLQLVIGSQVPAQADPTIATKVGARIASSDVTKLELAGEVPLFPTEAFQFSGTFPSTAPWVLSVSYGELNDSFLGSVRLLINTEHPAGRAALEDGGASAALVRSALRVDVVRSLLAAVISQERHIFDVDREYDRDSIGYLVDSLCKNNLRSNLHLISKMMLNQPIEFELQLQSHFGYLDSVG